MLSLFLGSIFVSAVTGTATTSVFGSYKAAYTTLGTTTQSAIPWAKNKCTAQDTTTAAKAAETWPERAVEVDATGDVIVRVAPRTAGAASDKFTFVVKTGQEWGISKTFHDADALKSKATLGCQTASAGTAFASFYPSKDCVSPRYTLEITESDYYNETTYVFTHVSTAPKKVSNTAEPCTNLLYAVPADDKWSLSNAANAGCTFKTGSGFFRFTTSTKLKQGAVTFQHSLSDTSAVESPEVYIDEVTSEIEDLVITTSSSAGRGRGNVTWKFTALAAAAGNVNGRETGNAEFSKKILSDFKLSAGKVRFEANAECYMYQGTAAAKSNEVHYTVGATSEITFVAPQFEAGEVVLTCNNALNPVSAEVNTTFGTVEYSVWSAVTGDMECKSTAVADNGITKAGAETAKVYLQKSYYKGYAPLGAIAEADFDGACSVGAGVLSSFLVVAASLMCA